MTTPHPASLEAGAEPSEPSGLEALSGMSETELVALSHAVVAPGRQRRMKALLRKNAEGELGDLDRQELDALLEEADRVALLKARAAYTLSRVGREHTAVA